MKNEQMMSDAKKIMFSYSFFVCNHIMNIINHDAKKWSIAIFAMLVECSFLCEICAYELFAFDITPHLLALICGASRLRLWIKLLIN